MEEKEKLEGQENLGEKEDTEQKKGRKKKKERVLTPAEHKRLEDFTRLTEDMKAQGYTYRLLTIGIGFANVFAAVFLIPLFVIGYGLFYLIHHRFEFIGMGPVTFVVVFVVLIIVHELIHGISWSLFAPHHFGDIAFGFMKSTLTPYCTCLVPLKKWQQVFGAAMPLILLGILPMIFGLVTGNMAFVFMGIVMTDGASGDILVIHKILTYKSTAMEVIYIDHPTEAGTVVFER